METMSNETKPVKNILNDLMKLIKAKQKYLFNVFIFQMTAKSREKEIKYHEENSIAS